MTQEKLSNRQLQLLAIVAEGRGTWDARRIDITMTSRHGAGSKTIFAELQYLERLGLVTAEAIESTVGGRWNITPEANSLLS
jgi:hypothetical protein